MLSHLNICSRGIPQQMWTEFIDSSDDDDEDGHAWEGRRMADCCYACADCSLGLANASEWASGRKCSTIKYFLELTHKQKNSISSNFYYSFVPNKVFLFLVNGKEGGPQLFMLYFRFLCSKRDSEKSSFIHE